MSTFFSLSVKMFRKSLRILRYFFQKQICTSCLILINIFHRSTHSISKLNKNTTIWFKTRLLSEKKQRFLEMWSYFQLCWLPLIVSAQHSTPSNFVKFTFQMMQYQIFIGRWTTFTKKRHRSDEYSDHAFRNHVECKT